MANASNSAEEDSIILTIDPNLTETKMLKAFKPLYTEYKIFMNLQHIRLQSDTNETHIFNHENIRRVGVIDNCFIISLGRNKKYGTGYVALRSSHPKANIIYHFLHKTALACFNQSKNLDVKETVTETTPPTISSEAVTSDASTTSQLPAAHSRTASGNVKQLDEIREDDREEKDESNSSTTDEEDQF